MKRFSALLIALILVLTVPSFAMAEDGKVIYSENFEREDTADTAATMEALGWKVLNKSDGALTDNTATYTIENGKLKLQNYAGGTIEGKDSYALILDSEAMKEYCQGDFTLQYDLCYIDAGASSRYVVIVTNYDGNNSYYSFHLRLRGDGNNQVRLRGEWFTLDGGVASTQGNYSIITKVFGKEQDVNALGLQNVNLTIRYQNSIEKGITVFVRNNDEGGDFIEVTNTTDKSYLGRMKEAYAVALKAGGMVDSYVDNIVLWTGTGDMPAAE